MNFTELRTEVLGLTKRPDLLARTDTAIRAAILSLHTKDYFARDLYEVSMDFGSELTQHSFDYSFVPRFRALKYLRRTDFNNTDTGAFLEVITPESVLDEYARNKENVVYLAGTEIKLRAYPGIRYARLGCYRFPNVQEAGFESWIANDFPYAIIYRAASKICASIGKTEEANAFQADANEAQREMMQSNILLQGY